MLIEVHYGDCSVLLVNGNCRSIHLLNYIRTCCCLSSSIKLDLCLLNSGEPFHLSSHDTKFVSSDKHCFPSHSHCVLTKIDDDGTYIPLLNDPKLITNEFLAKLKRATTTTTTITKENPIKTNVKSRKQSANSSSNEKPKRRRSLKSVAIVASFVTKSHH